MLSGNKDCHGLRRTLFPLLLIAAVPALLLPYMLVLLSDTPGIIGIPHRESAITEDSDVYEQAWHFWWVSSALQNGQDPRFCPLIYSPEGVSLVYDHIGWHDTLIFAIIGIGKEHPALSHTLSLLLGTMLTAIFGWLLARSWGADRYGALFTALALAWLPSRTAHLLQHYQLANCWTLPASLWLCREYLRKGKLKTLAAFAAIVMLAAVQSPFIAIFAVLGLPATCFIIGGNWKRTAILAGGAGLAAAVVGILILTAPGHITSPSTHWREAIYWAAEPQSFILPSPFGPAGYLFGIPARFSWMSNTAEGVVSPGLTVLAAFVILIWRRRKWRLPVVILGLGLLALGPELRILGRPLGIPLPFRILQLFPVLDGIRTPSRFAILAGLFTAVGAGMGITLVKRRWKLLFLSLLMFELWIPVFSVLSTRIPSACMSIPAGSTVLEVPVDNNVRRYAWFQTGNSCSRRYAFLARLPETGNEDYLLQESLERGDVVVYHRWLFDEEDRNRYDTLYAELFPEGSNADSVWILMNGGSQ
ncbi:MAG: hypothetical protein GQ565_04235 [Candidatus Aegiribacteria sp.]|nr:hypothetical protein [Candidatus Aegiribacteria sp.]